MGRNYETESIEGNEQFEHELREANKRKISPEREAILKDAMGEKQYKISRKKPSFWQGAKTEVKERIAQKREEIRSYPEKVGERRRAYKESFEAGKIAATKERARAEARSKVLKGGFFKKEVRGGRVVEPRPVQRWAAPQQAPMRNSDPLETGLHTDNVNIFANRGRSQGNSGMSFSPRDIEFVPPKQSGSGFGIKPMKTEFGFMKKKKGAFGGFI